MVNIHGMPFIVVGTTNWYAYRKYVNYALRHLIDCTKEFSVCASSVSLAINCNIINHTSFNAHSYVATKVSLQYHYTIAFCYTIYLLFSNNRQITLCAVPMYGIITIVNWPNCHCHLPDYDTPTINVQVALWIHWLAIVACTLWIHWLAIVACTLWIHWLAIVACMLWIHWLAIVACTLWTHWLAIVACTLWTHWLAIVACMLWIHWLAIVAIVRCGSTG